METSCWLVNSITTPSVEVGTSKQEAYFQCNIAVAQSAFQFRFGSSICLFLLTCRSVSVGFLPPTNADERGRPSKLLLDGCKGSPAGLGQGSARSVDRAGGKEGVPIGVIGRRGGDLNWGWRGWTGQAFESVLLVIVFGECDKVLLIGHRTEDFLVGGGKWLIGKWGEVRLKTTTFRETATATVWTKFKGTTKIGVKKSID